MMNEDMLKKMAFLSALHEAEKDNASDTENLFVMSVIEATAFFDKHIGRNHGKILTRLVDFITDSDSHVYGTPAEYHNLIARFSRIGDNYSALRICDHALKFFPYSVDVLADAIQAAGESGLFDKGETYICTANKINKECWTWTLFAYTIIFYQQMFYKVDPTELDSIYETALMLSREYQTYFPLDGVAYNEEAEILLFKNKISEAKEVLRKAIFEPVFIKPNEPSSIIAAQCCVTLINEILDDSDQYDLIIATAQKGIEFTTQEQEKARIGYFVYRSALAKDALIVRGGYRNKADIQEALREYQCAYDLNQDMSYTSTIEKRYAILCQNSKNPIEDMPLIKRPLSISPDNEV